MRNRKLGMFRKTGAQNEACEFQGVGGETSWGKTHTFVGEILKHMTYFNI